MSLLADLMVKGACVRLETRQWTGRARLGPEHFGLDEVDDQIVVLPQGYLIPKERILKIENILYGARREVQRFSVGFPIPDVYFVTIKSYERLDFTTTASAANLKSEIERLVADWEDLLAVARGRWEVWLAKCYEHLTEAGKQAITLGSFVQRGVDALTKVLPSKASLPGRFKISLSAFQLSIPTQATGGKVTVAEAMARLSAFEKVESSWDEMVKGFAKDTAKVLRERVVEAVDRVSRVLKDGVLRKPTIDLLRNTATEIGDLNFLGDADLAEKLGRLKGIADKVEVAYRRDDDKTRNDLAMALDGVVAEIKSNAALAGEKAAESFGGLGKRKIEV